MKRIQINVQTGEMSEVDLTPEEIAAMPPPGTAPVPQSVSKRQAVQALIIHGLHNEVEARLAAIPGIEGDLARAEWRESNWVERDRPLVLQLGAQLGLDAAAMDALFMEAASL